MIALCIFNLNAGEPDYSSWVRIMTDEGTDKTAWIVSGKFKKELDLDVSPAEIKAAAVEYEIAVNPYDRDNKTRIRRKKDIENYNWNNFQVRINGELVFDKPAGKFISKGTHRIIIPVDKLKEGKNSIELGWGANQEGKVRGYIYFAIDQTKAEIERRKISRAKRPPADPAGFHVRLLIKI